MKRVSTIFLRGVIGLFAIAALAFMIKFPSMEGRAAHLDLWRIYTDPFILYSYAASIPFYVALYKAFKLLGYIGQNKAFSVGSASAVKSIKHCAFMLSILIGMTGLYIRIFHHKNDDPAGFIVICTLATFLCLVVAAATTVFEKIIQNGIEIKSVNEQLQEQLKK